MSDFSKLIEKLQRIFHSINGCFSRSVCSALALVFFSVFLCQHADAGGIQPVKLFSHRGIQTGYPENSLQALKSLISKGVDGAEIDLRTTSDGHIILMHDERIDRGTDGQGEVKAKRWEEMRNLQLKDNSGNVTPYSIPELAEVLQLIKSHPHFEIAFDLKDVDPESVARQVLLAGVERQVLFFVADPMQVELARSITGLNSELRIIVDMLTWWKIEDVPLFAAKALNADMLFSSEWFFPKRGFQMLQKEGVPVAVYLWGVHDLEQRFQRAVELGASTISTDDPFHLLPIVQQMKISQERTASGN